MLRKLLLAGVAAIVMNAIPAQAHGPIFSPGPETLYKEGIESHLEYHRSKKGDEIENELALGLGYGITEDWLVSVELPYARIKEDGGNSEGIGNISLETKYRLWRRDALGKQDSISGFAKVILDTAKDTSNPELSSGANDLVLGLAYGQESLIWQRWASARYRINGESDAGIERGSQIFADAAIGWRSEIPQYYKSDVLWMMELNTEYTERSKQNGVSFSDTGGTEIFLAPGMIWAYRNIALKSGVQFPVYSNLNGAQSESDYRIRFALDMNF